MVTRIIDATVQITAAIGIVGVVIAIAIHLA